MSLLLSYLKTRVSIFYGVGKCNTLIELHQNERDPNIVQVWDCAVEDNLKELIGTTYTNNMYILFSSPSLKNSTVKCVLACSYEMSDLLGSFSKSV